MLERTLRNPLLLLPTIVVAVSFILTGCAKRPDTEITAAKAGAEKARSVEAALYAPEAFIALEESEKALDRELMLQGDKNFLTRKYDNARRMAESVSVKATEVEKAALDNKASAREEASRLIQSARSLLLEVGGMIAKAPSAKGSALDLQVLKEDLASMEITLDQAANEFASEKYLDAQKSAGLAITTGNSVKSDLSNAIQMKAGSRPASKAR
ncbi:MAG: hypothetical protein ABIK65_09575 [Candidatus Eisenbacteria bacterium]